MRRQRYNYTLPAHDESSSLEAEDVGNYDDLVPPDSLWPQMLAQGPEPVVPYGPFQYTYPSDTDQLHSFSSLLDAQQLISNSSSPSYDCFSYLSGGPLESLDFLAASYDDPFCQGELVVPFDESTPFDFQNLPQEIPDVYPMVTNYGAVTLILRHFVRVDITPNRGIYVTNPPANCVAVMSGLEDKSCVLHPNGRVLHDGANVFMLIGNRSAKICRRGVVFTSLKHSLSYLVDASGTKTTAEKFPDLSRDFSLEVFYGGAAADDLTAECYRMLAESSYKAYSNGDEVWNIGGVRVKQDEWGEVRASRAFGRRYIRTSPTIGNVTLKTQLVNTSVSCDPSRFFSVTRGDRRVTATVCGLTVQNGSQKAGFNRCGRLVLF